MMALLMINGCGDYAARREVSFTQLSTSTNTVGDRYSTFEVDTSRLPPGWIEKQSVEHKPWGDATRIELGDHAVKILLVPATENAPAK